MIRLNLPRDNHWLTLPHGVRLLVSPIDTAIDAAVRSVAVHDLRELTKKFNAPPAASAEPWRTGQVKAILVRTLGEMTILGWQGVLTDDGAPAPITAANIALLMAIPDLATSFMRQIYAPLDQLAAEGEDCGVAPNGTLVAAPGIATGAGPASVTAATPAPT